MARMSGSGTSRRGLSGHGQAFRHPLSRFANTAMIGFAINQAMLFAADTELEDKR